MGDPLPRLRLNLDFLPSPVSGRPGLMIRDPYRYSDLVLIIPPPLAPLLSLFDGQQTDLDLRAALARITGDLRASDLARQLCESLSQSGFLEDHTFQTLRLSRHREFADSPQRLPAHAGSAYPAEAGPLRQTLMRYLDGARPSSDSMLAIAAPHVSPEGGWESYQAAYAALRPEYRDRTFVILGASHYGEPERFGLTRKPFSTPFGDTLVDTPLVDWLAERAGPAAQMEDYCHSVEHSIEFQVVFLQHVYGADIRILPVLCGPFARSIYSGGPPEEDENIARFLDALGELAAREAGRLFWVLGIDMAHIGRRYGDPFPALAGRGEMQRVAEDDQARIDRLLEGDGEGFWALVQENRDELKWCGSSPLYTFLQAVRPSGGTLLRYQQWNIDPESVVSFAGISFTGR